jgi:hypothetical protein
MKIVLHAFGTFAVTLRHLLDETRARAPDIEWAVILPTSHQRHVFKGLLPDRDILCLEDLQPRWTKRRDDLSEIRDYGGSIFVDIETEKRTFKHRPAWEQLGRAIDIYRIYKEFLIASKATHLLLSQIEEYEAKMLIALGRELGVEVMVPTTCRNLGGSFFSSDAQETLPTARSATPELVDRATSIVRRFREEGGSTSPPPDHYDPNDERLSDFQPSLPLRTARYIRRTLSRPEMFERDHLRASLLNNLPRIRDSIWWARTKIAEGQYDVGATDALPRRFIFYPLQMTPESSINTPAPFFVDQMRAIDAIRFAMPNDCHLLVKEHPSSISTRPVSFVRAARRRAGVVVAHCRMPSRELIQRAACTISVTGTATFEAFLLGRPSLVLGSSLVAEYLGGVCPIHLLRTRLPEVMDRRPSDQTVIRAVAEILSVRHDFTFGAPGGAGEPTLRRRNIQAMSRALLQHVGYRNASADQHAEGCAV